MKQSELLALLKEMTLEEKIGQLFQSSPEFFKGSKNRGEITGPMKTMNIDEAIVSNVGSVLGATGASEIISIQKEHLKNNRLGIPLLFMADVIHGYQTIFPIPLAIGSSWDLELAEESAKVAAKEAAVSGLHLTFSPMVDLVRDPRWGRVMESTGEDAYLNGEFGKAFVRGYQGDDLKNDLDRIAACVKHFAGYGAAEGGRDYNTVDVTEWQLREYHLPAFKAVLDEGVKMVMTAFNTVKGIPATGNKWLMRDVLREEWGFDGVVISDWGAVLEQVNHGVAKDDKEAALKSIIAGVDIEMMTPTYVHNLKELIEENKIQESLIDEAVLRILELKNELGLFENPYRAADESLEKTIVFSDEHRQLARKLATKSAVLLKNENVLPLTSSQKIALVGPFANNTDLLGAWSCNGSTEEVTTLAEGMAEKLAENSLFIAEGCDIETGTEKQWETAKEAILKADVVVLALGESSDMSGEAASRADIKLPKAQLELIQRVKQLNKPTVTVLFNGRPLDLHGVIDTTEAVLEAWYPGSEGGRAVADLLFGDENPSGKLTMSFPYSVGQIPVYYNAFNTGRPKGAEDNPEKYVSKYLDIPNAPLLPFGFGLSYTNFEYTDAHLSDSILNENNSITLTVNIKNTGNHRGEEVVQLYIQDRHGEVVRPLKELKGFKKIFLDPGETKEVTFEINEKMLRYHHFDFKFTSDEGEFIAYVGPNSRDVIELPFKLEKS